MTWVKIDDTLPQNPKVRAVSVPARWTYLSSICYAGLNKTDGFVPASTLLLLDGNAKISDELVAAKLWETRPDGWYVHDYLKYNRSKEKAVQVSEERRSAGSKGAANRWQIATEKNGKTIASGEQIAGNLFLSASPSVSLSEREGVQGERDDAIARLCRSWENATGTTVTASLGDSFGSWLEKLPEAAIVKAMAETGANGAKAWRYTEAILRRYQADGWAPRPEPVPLRPPEPEFKLRNVWDMMAPIPGETPTEAEDE